MAYSEIPCYCLESCASLKICCFTGEWDISRPNGLFFVRWVISSVCSSRHVSEMLMWCVRLFPWRHSTQLVSRNTHLSCSQNGGIVCRDKEENVLFISESNHIMRNTGTDLLQWCEFCRMFLQFIMAAWINVMLNQLFHSEDHTGSVYTTLPNTSPMTCSKQTTTENTGSFKMNFYFKGITYTVERVNSSVMQDIISHPWSLNRQHQGLLI